ncbi:hypothetical protein O181_065078 [Austropuccinia psidii MF-1]|uniref:Uncharacterized protein n=1 Tax=Austropuccinia psidii MF-1 TaxID=1389203 RepID=A0A9Q3EP29_9BASI|nr:hypothetical protein [Austropuccinia psidii MF-1]
MPLARSGERHNPSSSSQKGYGHDYGRSQSVTEGQGSVNEAQNNKLCHYEAYNTFSSSNRAETATRSLCGHRQSQPEGLQQCLVEQRVPDPYRSVEQLHELLPDYLKRPQEASVDIYKDSQKAYNNALQNNKYQILTDLWKNCMNYYLTVRKFLGYPNTCKLLNGWNPSMEKKNMMLLKAEWRKNNSPPPKQVPKTAPIDSSRNSNITKQPQAQNKGKGNAPATKPCSQVYIIPKIWQDAVEIVFQMARAMMQL